MDGVICSVNSIAVNAKNPLFPHTLYVKRFYNSIIGRVSGELLQAKDCHVGSSFLRFREELKWTTSLYMEIV